MDKMKKAGEALNNININKRMEFETRLTEAIMEEFDGRVSVDLHMTVKNNGASYRAISIRAEGSNVAPNFRVDDYMKAYERGDMSMGDIVGEMAKEVRNTGRDLEKKVSVFTDYEKISECIFIRLISVKQNKERLEKLAHRKFLDLAITYYFAIFDDVNGVNGLVNIDKEHLDIWGVTEEELYLKARDNTEKKLPYDLKRFDEILPCTLHERLPLYVLSNKRCYNGAASIIYPKVLCEVAERLHSDFLIIPSSIHELIVFPYSEGDDIKEIDEMIKEVNTSHVPEEDVLSDHAYIYYRRTMSIR